jgi:radical SAM enzyme (TIGR01210 family)
MSETARPGTPEPALPPVADPAPPLPPAAGPEAQIPRDPGVHAQQARVHLPIRPAAPVSHSANASERLGSSDNPPLSSSETPEPGAANASERARPGNREIEALRPARNGVDAERPYHFLHEREAGPFGVETVNTLFLTGKECAFKCLMCDLWKNTLDGPTPPGAIPRQIDYALRRLPVADSIKLYNSSNFFDPKAVPVSDYPAILERVRGYRRVIVENHPRLIGDNCLHFRDGLRHDRSGGPGATLEIAMGLETIHPVALPAMNKQLTPADFQRAAGFLIAHGIRVRAFVLLNPPYITDPREGIRWAVETVRFAFECGAQCCSIIATRPGNGIMETLQAAGDYVPPTLEALEEVFASCLALAHENVTLHHATPCSADTRTSAAAEPQRRLVFVDTWDIGFLSACPACFEARKNRLDAMNLTQTIHQPIACICHS